MARMVSCLENSAVPWEYRHDAEKLVDIAARNGIVISAFAAYRAWDSHSDSYAATWLGLESYDDEQIIYILKSHSQGIQLL